MRDGFGLGREEGRSLTNRGSTRAIYLRAPAGFPVRTGERSPGGKRAVALGAALLPDGIANTGRRMNKVPRRTRALMGIALGFIYHRSASNRVTCACSARSMCRARSLRLRILLSLTSSRSSFPNLSFVVSRKYRWLFGSFLPGSNDCKW